jgi:hypothetical protein
MLSESDVVLQNILSRGLLFTALPNIFIETSPQFTKQKIFPMQLFGNSKHLRHKTILKPNNNEIILR